MCPASSSSGGPAGSAPGRLRAPGRLSSPGSPMPPCPMVPRPWGGQPRGHLPAAALPGDTERGLPPEPHSALPGRGQEGIKMNSKIGYYN